jgi:hypothetical protein
VSFVELHKKVSRDRSVIVYSVAVSALSLSYHRRLEYSKEKVGGSVGGNTPRAPFLEYFQQYDHQK